MALIDFRGNNQRLASENLVKNQLVNTVYPANGTIFSITGVATIGYGIRVDTSGFTLNYLIDTAYLDKYNINDIKYIENQDVGGYQNQFLLKVLRPLNGKKILIGCFLAENGIDIAIRYNGYYAGIIGRITADTSGEFKPYGLTFIHDVAETGFWPVFNPIALNTRVALPFVFVVPNDFPDTNGLIADDLIERYKLDFFATKPDFNDKIKSYEAVTSPFYDSTNLVQKINTFVEFDEEIHTNTTFTLSIWKIAYFDGSGGFIDDTANWGNIITAMDSSPTSALPNRIYITLERATEDTTLYGKIFKMQFKLEIHH